MLFYDLFEEQLSVPKGQKTWENLDVEERIQRAQDMIAQIEGGEELKKVASQYRTTPEELTKIITAEKLRSVTEEMKEEFKESEEKYAVTHARAKAERNRRTKAKKTKKKGLFSRLFGGK
ncbi:hypothetical protein ACFLZO_00270 [Patescibacteria group bacterium]